MRLMADQQAPNPATPPPLLYPDIFSPPSVSEPLRERVRLANESLGIEASYLSGHHGPGYVVLQLPKQRRKLASELKDNRSKKSRADTVVEAVRLCTEVLMTSHKYDADRQDDMKDWFAEIEQDSLRERLRPGLYKAKTGRDLPSSASGYAEEPARSPSGVDDALAKEMCLKVAKLMDTTRHSKKLCNHYVQILAHSNPVLCLYL